MVQEWTGETSFCMDSKWRPHGYRLRICKDDKLQIWIQDTTAFTQWVTTSLAIPDFVRASSVIPRATIQDYAQCVVSCLELSSGTPSSGATLPVRSLTYPSIDDGSRVLRVCVASQIATLTSFAVEYEFTLNAVALDKQDLLETRIHAVEAKTRSLSTLNATLRNRVVMMEQPAYPATPRVFKFMKWLDIFDLSTPDDDENDDNTSKTDATRTVATVE